MAKIVKIPRLSVVETVTSAKLAEKLNSSWNEKDRKLKVMVQVNTSGEENKNGIAPDELSILVRKCSLQRNYFKIDKSCLPCQHK